MMEYEARIEEGVTLDPLTLELTDYFQYCFELLESEQEHRLIADPFYQRTGDRPSLTIETADEMIAALDEEYEKELKQYPGYHRNRSGANHSPDFKRMGERARVAMAEGIDAIVQRHELKVQRQKEDTTIRATYQDVGVEVDAEVEVSPEVDCVCTEPESLEQFATAVSPSVGPIGGPAYTG